MSRRAVEKRNRLSVCHKIDLAASVLYKQKYASKYEQK